MMPEKPPENPPETGGKPLETGEKPYLQPVDMTDHRSFMEKFMADPDRTAQREKIAELAKGFRDACEEFDHEEIIEFIEQTDISAQEITGMLNYLEHEVRMLRHRNDLVIDKLKRIKPKRIWG